MRALAGVPRQKLQLVNGIPVTIALEYATGKRYPSRFADGQDQIMYSLKGNRVAYFSLEVAAMIEELGLTPGEPFTICTWGPRKWEVTRAAAQRPVQFPQPAPPPPPVRPAAQSYAQPPAVVVAPGTQEAVTRIEDALKAAIRAAANGERYSSEIGYRVQFTSEDIQGLASTIYIQRCREQEGARR